MQVVKKFHPTRGILRRGSRQRVNNDRGLLPLKFIDRSNASAAGKTIREPIHLIVERSDDEHVIQGQRLLFSIAIGPFDSLPGEEIHERDHARNFL